MDIVGAFDAFSHLRLMAWSTQTQNKLVTYDISANGKMLIRCLGGITIMRIKIAHRAHGNINYRGN